MKDEAPPVRAGELIEVSAAQLVAGGEAIARVDGFPIFIGGLYPGDLALVEITEVRKGFGRARVERILVESSWRRVLPCPIADRCGGCDWTSLRLDRQIEAKHGILRDSLVRVGKLSEHAIPPIRLHPSPLNYRLRSRLQIDPVDRSVGFFAAKTNEVIPLVPECEVVGPEVIRNLESLRASAASSESDSVETFETDRSFSFSFRDERNREGPPVSVQLRGLTFQLSTSAFFQVNRHLLGTMIDLVREHAGRTVNRGAALDLYAGVGFFTLALASLFESVTGVETSPISHRWGSLNAAGAPNVSMVRADVGRYLEGRRHANFIMVDPPRAGLPPEVTERIAATGAENICYLSCDPVTFSRDVSRLGRRGWILRSLDLLDLFPNTHHIETLSSFERER